MTIRGIECAGVELAQLEEQEQEEQEAEEAEENYMVLLALCLMYPTHRAFLVCWGRSQYY